MAEGRKAISKAMRQQVYDSLNGHCGYCGCKITIKEMQVDHIEAVYLHEKELKAGLYADAVCEQCKQSVLQKSDV